MKFEENSSSRLDDFAIRTTLRSQLEEKINGANDIILVEELGVLQGNFRVDLATINGHIHGYEIKSDVDTLARLKSQVQAYSSIFDYLTIVVAARHLSHVRKAIPAYCGIVVANIFEGQVSLKNIRKPKKNVNTQPEALVQLLWRDEAYFALKELKAFQGMQNKSRKVLWSKLVELLPSCDLQALVTQTIRRRTNWKTDLRPE